MGDVVGKLQNINVNKEKRYVIGLALYVSSQTPAICTMKVLGQAFVTEKMLAGRVPANA